MPQAYVIIPPPGTEPADEWVRLGIEAQMTGKLPDAQRHYQKALQLDPRHVIATQNLAIVFAQATLLNEALLTIERASILDSEKKHGQIYTNWALMELESDHIEAALDRAMTGYTIMPSNETRLALAQVYATAGHPDKAIPLYEEMLEADPKHPVAGPNICFVQTLCDLQPKDLLVARGKWHTTHAHPQPYTSWSNDRTPDRPLRVGYVSGDFKCHSAAMIFRSVVSHHSAAVVPYFYSSLPIDAEKDIRSKSFKTEAGDRWRDITTANDDAVASMVREDKIDILIDLAGHTNGGRLPVFTKKPAPIQASGWGFAHGTGCPEIDYFFADPIAVPLHEREHYAEKIIDLPCIVSYDPPAEYALVGTSSLPAYRNGYITFGTYARYEKMSDLCLRTFAEILRKVPDAKIEFKDNAYRRPYSIRRILKIMDDIDPKRLLFMIASAHDEHMRTYQQADIILDPFPHGGGVVSLEQLYMGVPMVTRYGTQPSGRSAASVLTAMGKQDWVAQNTDEYIAKAVAMADDWKMLAAERKTLQQVFLNSPVIKGYAEAVEVAYRKMWQAWLDK